jgi:hypothetical protein
MFHAHKSEALHNIVLRNISFQKGKCFSFSRKKGASTQMQHRDRATFYTFLTEEIPSKAVLNRMINEHGAIGGMRIGREN